MGTLWNDSTVAGQIEQFRVAHATDPSIYGFIAFEAMVESASWKWLTWPLPAQSQFKLDWQWDEARARFVNEYWTLETFANGSWEPVR